MKKALLMALSFILVAAISITGTMAFLADTDSDVNVMTYGNVSIAQHEYERATNEDGTYKTDTIDGQNSYVLQDFTQAKPLLPATDPTNNGAGDWDTTTVRMSQVDSYGGMQVFVNPNAQDKFVTVENTGTEAAYIRTLIAIEYGTSNAGLIGVSYHTTWEKIDIGTISIDGNNYYVIEYAYKGGQLSDGSWRHGNGILPAGDTSYPNLSQVYLKSEATNEDCEALDGNDNGTIEILVLSQAVQAQGFANAETALDAAFGEVTTENAAVWFGAENVPVTVSSVADMKAALEAGEKDLVVKGVTVSENPFNGHYYKDRNIDFVDCTFTANMNYMYINDATFTNCTFDCGSANSAVHYDELFGDLVFNNCTFTSGKIQIGANKDVTGTVTFNNCEFAETASTSIWSEKGIRVYSPAEFNNCEFNNRVVMAGSNGLPITFNSCTMNDGTPVYYVDNATGIIRGGNVPNVTINSENNVVLVETTDDLTTALEDGGYVVLSNDLSSTTTATGYGQADVKVNGGTLDGNGNTLSVAGDGDYSAVSTTGGTIQNLNIDDGFRAVFLENMTEDVYLKNMKIGGEGVCYAINTGVNTGEYSLIVDDCEIRGWSSFAQIKSASFTNCTFAQGEYYDNVFGRLVKPYVDTVFENCEFNSKFYIDLSAFEGEQIVLKNCTVNGVLLTAENWKDLIVAEDDCGEGQISIEAKDGSYMTVSNVLDYVVIQ